MMVLNVLLLILLVRFSINFIFDIYIASLLLTGNKKYENIIQLQNGKKLYVILPVFQETTLITETIQYWESVLENYEEVYLCIVGTKKERTRKGINPTLEKIHNIAINNHKITVMEYDGGGIKAHQSNYATDKLQENSNTWFLFEDIDSRPGKKGMNELIDHVNKDHNIIQQNAFFLSNYTNQSLLQKAQSLYQSRWTISHEIKRIILNNWMSYFVAHVVGHGLCMNAGKFYEYGKWPTETPIEDINLGFYLCSSGEKIYFITELESADSPVTLWEGLKQEYTWSYGAMLYFSFWRNFKNKLPLKWQKNKYRTFIISMHGALSYLNWLSSSWIILLLTILAFKNNLIALLILFIYFFEHMVAIFVFYKKGDLNLAQAVKANFIVPLEFIRRSLPANFALVNFLFSGKMNKHKTNHD